VKVFKDIMILKALVYRVFRIILLLIVSYFVVGNIAAAISISFIDAGIATLYYYYFDKFWDILVLKFK